MGIAPSVIGNEDSGKCWTPPIARILPKELDPRSPTEGIVRTPIEVKCTPKGKNVATPGSSLASFDTPRRGKCDYDASEIIKKLNVDCIDQGTELIQTEMVEIACQGCENNQGMAEISEIECNSNRSDISDDHFTVAKDEAVPSAGYGQDHENGDEMNFESPMKKVPYLETDIDKIDDKFMSRLFIEHPRVKQLKSRKNINKTETSKTEICENGVENISEGRLSESVLTRIDNLSLSDIPSFDNLSLMVSDNEDVSMTTHHGSVCKPTVQDWLITIEDNCDSLLPFDISLSDDVMKCEISSSRVDISKSTTCTPDSKKNQTLTYERTPLSCLVQNNICEPIKEESGLKRKQWRGIQEERQRRGLSLGDENTPPLQSPLDKVSSAPGKLAMRRRNIIDWDDDNSSVVI